MSSTRGAQCHTHAGVQGAHRHIQACDTQAHTGGTHRHTQARTGTHRHTGSAYGHTQARTGARMSTHIHTHANHTENELHGLWEDTTAGRTSNHGSAPRRGGGVGNDRVNRKYNMHAHNRHTVSAQQAHAKHTGSTAQTQKQAHTKGSTQQNTQQSTQEREESGASRRWRGLGSLEGSAYAGACRIG
jgi:hypothetical protein